jgi:sporulation protein YlmC with PRC-barrel domain
MLTAIPHMTADQMVSSKIVGTSVYNTNNDKIGEVNDLILDSNGKVAGVVIGVGGFLGMGERNVAVSYTSVKFSKDNRGYERITVPATKDQLKAMTPYDSTKTNG